METSKSINELYEEALEKLDTEIEAKKQTLYQEYEKKLLIIENQELTAKKNLKIVMIEDLKFEKEDPDKAFLRKLRRAKEISTNKIVSPGPWDEDLDTYQDEEASIYIDQTINEGYKADIKRNHTNHSWDIIITVPKNHWTLITYYNPADLYDRIQKNDFEYKLISVNYTECELGFDSGSTRESYADMYCCMQISKKIIDRLKKPDMVSLVDKLSEDMVSLVDKLSEEFLPPLKTLSMEEKI